MKQDQYMMAFIVLGTILITSMFMLINSVSEEIQPSGQIGIAFSPDGVDYEEHNLTQSYNAGDQISGTVTLSLDEAPADYVVNTNFDGNISLLEWIQKHGFSNGGEYNCSTPNCMEDYVAQEAISSLIVTDNVGEIAGYSISGASVSAISAAELTISSNVAPSCFPQLSIDVLDDTLYRISNTKTTGSVCSTVYEGCFSEGDSEGSVIITQDQYCEQIELPAAPGFELRAAVQNSTEGSDELTMKLYDSDVDFIAECVLPDHTQDGVETLGCVVNHTAIAQDTYFVCISAATEDANYKIAFETVEPTCGTNDFNSLGTDYAITAQSLEFDSIIDLSLDTAFEETYGFPLTDYLLEYVFAQYGGECASSNCALPIRFAGQDQTLSLSDPRIRYTAAQGETEVETIHTLSVEPVSVDADELELDFENANFTIPLGSDENRFELYIDDELVFEETISLTESFDFSVTPTFVGFGQTTVFSASADVTITQSSWDFGDGTTETVNGNQASHRYLDDGEYTLEVGVQRTDGLSATKTFTIIVGDAETVANETIATYEERLDTLETDIAALPDWIEQTVRDSVDLVGLESAVTALANDYDLATTDEEIEEIVVSLINLAIPQEISSGERGAALPLLVGFDTIDPSYIEAISGDSAADPSTLTNNIAGWMYDNLDSTITFEEVTATYDGGDEVILTRFVVETRPINARSYESYLILGLDVAADGRFLKDYGQNTILGSGTYILLDSGQENEIIEFFVTGSLHPEDLGAHITPSVARLGDFDNTLSPCNFNSICEADIGEDSLNCEADCSAGRWPWFFIWIVVLAFAGLVAYIILQEWYKRHYERSLFKNPDDLYNLVNFIYNARRSGFVDGESRKKLKNAHWKGEQIRYAFRKIDGKRTGMYEIPLFKFIENRKVKKELTKRQGGTPVDRRFVRQPRF